MPQISILIINYNSGDRLPRVLRYIAAQHFQDFEVVVWDNASSDGSTQIDFPEGIEGRVIPHRENLGFAGGVMAAIPHCEGDWVAVLNPDAYPEPGWLAALWRGAERYGPSTVLGCVQICEGAQDRLDGLGDAYHISGTAWRGGFGKPAAQYPITEDVEIFAACFAGALFHKETFLDHGGLDTDFFCYHEDVDFGFRHRLFGGRSILIHDAVMLHEGSGVTGRYSDFTVFHGIRNRQWTFIKNMPTPLLPVAVPAFVLFSVAFLIRSFMLGIGKSYSRGWWAAWRGQAAYWQKRREIQSRRRISIWALARCLSWSPLAPLRRAPQLMKIGDELPPSTDRDTDQRHPDSPHAATHRSPH